MNIPKDETLSCQNGNVIVSVGFYRGHDSLSDVLQNVIVTKFYICLPGCDIDV